MWDICRLFYRLTFANCIWCKKHEMFVSISPGSVLLEAIALHTQGMSTLELLGLFMAFHDIGPCLRSGAWWYGQRAEAKFLEHCSCYCLSGRRPLRCFMVAALALSSLCSGIDYIWSFSETCFHWQFGIFLVTLINLFHTYNLENG